jgi:Protein of unknown function with HXXEE motif
MNTSIAVRYKPSVFPVVAIAVVILTLCTLMFIRIGFAPVLIIGGSATIAYFVWLATTYQRPVNPQAILPLYLAAVAAQMIHMVEEYATDFPGEFSRLFHLNLFQRDFFAITFMGVFGAVWLLTALGLLYRNPVANFLLWFFLIGPGLVNSVAHFSFPFFDGHFHYFPGLVTVLLPTIFTILVIRVLLKEQKQSKTE